MDDMVEGWTIMQDGTETPARRGRQFSVTLPDGLMDELRIYAARKALAPATLARQWLAERLEVERVEQLEREQKQGYRALEPDEQARRKTCPHCGDTHAALIDALTGATQCRACGNTFFTATKPRLEREG